MNSNCSDSPETPNLGQNRQFLAPVNLKFDGWPWKQQGNSSVLLQALCIISNPSVNSNWNYSPEKPKAGQKRRFVVPCDFEIWWMILKNNRVLFCSTLSLCIISKPSVNSNWSYDPGTLISGQNWRFFIPCDIEIWGKTLKNNRATFLCYAASSFMHHFIAIIEFKLE